MKQFLYPVLTFLFFIFCGAATTPLQAQVGVFDPNDPVVTYNPSAPPAKPAIGKVGKWVRTVRMSWNTSGYKSYIYNITGNENGGMLAFRLKFPKNYDPAKQYPIIIFLHGLGEFGTIYDNEYQLYNVVSTHSSAVDADKFNGFLLYPQSTTENWITGIYCDYYNVKRLQI